MGKRDRQGGLVYSTEGGRFCPGCRRPAGACVCRDRSRPHGGSDGIVRLQRETKGRKGAGVTLVTGLPLADDALQALASRLKRRCGVGGAVKDGGSRCRNWRRSCRTHRGWLCGRQPLL